MDREQDDTSRGKSLTEPLVRLWRVAVRLGDGAGELKLTASFATAGDLSLQEEGVGQPLGQLDIDLDGFSGMHHPLEFHVLQTGRDGNSVSLLDGLRTAGLRRPAWPIRRG